MSLAAAYHQLAQQLEQQAAALREEGVKDALWPDPPGPRELKRLAIDCRYLARFPQHDLPDRKPDREVTLEQSHLDLAVTEIDSVVEEALMSLWPGRPSTHTPVPQEEWDRLQEGLGCLSATERRTYLMVHGQGMTHALVAAELKTSRGSVSTLLKRARQKIDAWRQGRLPRRKGQRTSPPDGPTRRKYEKRGAEGGDQQH